MRGHLASIIELQTKYVDLQDFKKNSCLNIDIAIPVPKFSKENYENLSEAKIEQLKIFKKKRMRFQNSFMNADNLIAFS
jgi:hypothetical protein